MLGGRAPPRRSRVFPSARPSGPAIFAIGEACFLEIKIALDPAPDLVGDPSVAQQDVDELALRRYQFARQLDAGRRDVVHVGIERVRQLIEAGLMPGAQQLDY